MFLQLLTCPDLVGLLSSSRSSNRSRYGYSKLPAYDRDFCEKPKLTEASGAITDSYFTLLANLQLSVLALGTEFSCVAPLCAKAYPTATSEKVLPTFENNPPNLRKQGRLAITFALRKYVDIPNEKRIRIANEIEGELDKGWVGGEYRDRVYVVGGLLADEERGRELVTGLVEGRMRVEWMVRGWWKQKN
ncbi:hypothetical protein BDZ91DRAFT_791759 [Kalaharituber pfeilii]|nr:hypothetical protein BDZ91DRAFT_791759 [Kalaharituber pfeilii]